jgi:hypothetical protein
MRMRRRGPGLVAALFLVMGCAGASGMKSVPKSDTAAASIEYRAPNPLGRSRVVTLHADGRLRLQDVTRSAAGVREQRWESRADPGDFGAIVQMLTALEALPERPARTGIPGETIVELRVRPIRGTPWKRSKWLGDPVPAFDAPEARLSALARRVQAAPPDYDGPPTQDP